MNKNGIRFLDSLGILYGFLISFAIIGCVHFVREKQNEIPRLSKHDLFYALSVKKSPSVVSKTLLMIEVLFPGESHVPAPLNVINQNPNMVFLQVELPNCEERTLEKLNLLVHDLVRTQIEQRGFILSVFERASECLPKISSSSWARRAGTILIRGPKSLLFSSDEMDHLIKRTLVIADTEVDQIPGVDSFLEGLAARNIESKFLNFSNSEGFDAAAREFLSPTIGQN